jgi:ketosteroid isomerase-like protein
MTEKSAAAKDIALAFLQSFWDGEPERGLALCAEDALWTFQQSLPFPRHASIAEALDYLNTTLVAGFDPDSGYEVQVHNAIDDDGEEAAIEYSARGKTMRGGVYENDYLVRMTIRDGKIHSVRPYFDTHRVHKVLYDLDEHS